MNYKVGDKVIIDARKADMPEQLDDKVRGTVVKVSSFYVLVHCDIEEGVLHNDIGKTAYTDKKYWWCLPDYLTLVKEEEKVQFKVGDKVVYKNGVSMKYGTIKFIDDDGSCAIRFNKKDNPKMYSESLLIFATSSAMEKWYELEKPEPIVSIRIYVVPESRKTIARYFKDGKCVEQAEAKCSPNDKWDANYGAQLAMMRLMEKVNATPLSIEDVLDGTGLEYAIFVEEE